MTANQLGLQDSDFNMDEQQLELFLDIHKSKSDDSVLGKIIINNVDCDKRPLLIDYTENAKEESHVRVFKRKIKKEKKKNFCDYKKNICGYITKKIIREYLSSTYLSIANKLCGKYGCSYNQSKSFYLSKIEKVTGPSHVPSLLIPQHPNEIPIKQAFREFFQWFLKERYLRYLILEGKMQNKHAYIEYKNKNLMMLYSSSEGQLVIQQKAQQEAFSQEMSIFQ